MKEKHETKDLNPNNERKDNDKAFDRKEDKNEKNENVADEQKEKRGRPDKIDDRGNHR